MNTRRTSVAVIVIIALVTITTLVLGALGVVHYKTAQRKEMENARLALAVDAEQIAPSLRLPVWNFDHSQINQIVESMMLDPILDGVVVKSADNQAVICARHVDEGKVGAMKTGFVGDEYLVETRKITLGDETLATVTLVGTTKSVAAKMRQVLAWTIIDILTVDLILIGGIYLLLRRCVFKPLQQVEAYAASVRAGKYTVQTRVFHGELESLRISIGTMVGQLESRYTQLQAETNERERVTRLYAALSQVNEAIILTSDREKLFHEICRVLVEAGKFHTAWIGWLDAATKQVIPVAQSGDNYNFLSLAKIYADDRPEGRGPTGVAIREGKTCVANDVMNDPRTLMWRQMAEQTSIRSMAAFPIRQGGEICGSISVYGDDQDFFQDKEIALLEEAAADVSFALDNLAREEARRRGEDEIRWKTAFLEAQVDSALDGILVVDSRTRRILQNERLLQLFKVPDEIARDEDDMKLFEHVGKQVKNLEPFMKRVNYLYAHRDEVGRDEIELIDGTILDRYSAPVLDKAGKYYGRIWSFRDITGQRKLEEQFRQSQKLEAVGQLASGVAHDFNNILAAIQMRAWLLKSEPGLTTQQLDLAGEIEKSTQRAANLTRQLLLFSRKQAMQLQNLDLKAVVENIAKMLMRTLGGHVELQFKFSEQPVRIHADPGMIDQILLNLTVNARAAMPKGGKIVIETTAVDLGEMAASKEAQARPGAFACISVTDTGSGISPEIMSRIFEPFFTTKEVGKGTGLGLATVFGIVQQHKGWINVYSEVGRGTVFRVYLPRLSDSSDTHIIRAAKASIRAGNETILLVEDESALRVSVSTTLTRLGYHVLEAENGADALKLWSQHRAEIDLLLTDMVMPGGMTGRELARSLLQDEPMLKVIFVSGYSTDAMTDGLALKEGVNFLVKPFEVHKLAKAIRLCLD